MAMYQFLVAVSLDHDHYFRHLTCPVHLTVIVCPLCKKVRSAEQATGQTGMLTNDAGETTSHIQGLFNRTIRMVGHLFDPREECRTVVNGS